MKPIKLKNKPINHQSADFLADYFINVGVKPQDIPSFKNESYEYTPDPTCIVNMDAAVDMMYKLVEEKKKFFLQVDSDADGFTSAAIFYLFFKKNYPDIDIFWRLHDGKQHGIILDTIPDDRDVIIIPDAGSMQKEEHAAISAAGKYCIILDHHNLEQEILDNCPANVIIVNNQANNCKYCGLSGAGVVYMFIQEYQKRILGQPYNYDYEDLAALGIISDVMDSRELINHQIIGHGLQSINNRLFQELLMKQSYKIPEPTHPTKIDIAFYITPLINGLIRSGGQEEKEDFFKALIADPANDEIITSEYRGTERNETVWQHAARIAANAKSRQDAAKKKIIDFLTTKIEFNHLQDHKLLIVLLDEMESKKVDPNITGLAAMDICTHFNRPTLIMRYKQEEDGRIHYAGSARSNPCTELPSLRDFLLNSGLIEYAEGHDNALGVAVESKEQYEKLLAYADEQLKDINYDDQSVEVDYYFKGIINSNMLNCFASYKWLYGNAIPEPLFAFDLTVRNGDWTAMGKDKSSLKISSGGIDFVVFGAAEFISELTKNGTSDVTVIGIANINEWMGRRSIQVMIKDMNIKKTASGFGLRSLI